MSERDVERLLTESLRHRAEAAVGDDRVAPPPRFASGSSPGGRQRRWLLPIAAAAAVVVAVVAALLISDAPKQHPVAAGTPSTRPARPATIANNPLLSRVAGAPVQVRLANTDGETVGVGMPVLAYFSRPITDARALSAATTVTVNGVRARGAWYFEKSVEDPKYPLEGHFRLRDYWPAHASIDVSLAIRGLSAGRGLAYAENANLHFATGAALITTVSDSRHELTVTRDGRPLVTMPVSLGATSTPTERGVKVIMQKGQSICLVGPGYNECGVKYTQRLTYGGEYLHAAPWNVVNIGHRDTSNGCTNLTTNGARRLYSLLRVGDVVQYPDASGAPMSLAQGYGDWNVSWPKWRTGGLVRTH